MSLSPGTRIGPYEVLAPLGAGGMGQVFRARDTKLNRDVALKVLPDSFAADADRLARFTREAHTLASLNHPNIAHIHGLEESSGTSALVMELVEGEDLSQRMTRGTIPLDETVLLARQIAEALEAAHGQGVIHRDLKPANIKVRPDGRLKVLDFGLAKALDTADGIRQPADGRANSPTITSPAMTQAGMILGTAAYMSPEQARGKPVDKRADIWAFGVVLYEMLTGARLFDGDTISDTLAAVLKTEPDWTRLPAETPSGIRRLLRRCLERDPKRRFHDIADARIELDEGATEPPQPGPSSNEPTRARTPLQVAALLLVATLAFAAGQWMTRAPSSSNRGPAVAFAIQPSAGNPAIVSELALSRDGRRLVFLASDSRSLELREMAAIENRPITGTEGAQHPFISPDGQWLGFFADGKLKKVAFAGGDPVPICDAAFDGPGGAWAHDGSIYFSPTFTSGLFKVDANGGAPVQVTTIDRARGEAGHMWPDPLPGGTSLVFTIFGGSGMNGSKVALLDLQSGRYEVLFDGAAAKYASSGHLVFYRRGAHYVVPFDPGAGKVTGDARAVLRNVKRPDPTGEALLLAFSDQGHLAYVPGTTPSAARPSRLAWISRDGAQTPLPFEGVHDTGLGLGVRLSPDGQRAAVARYAQGENQVWVYDLLRGTQEQLTREGINFRPVWHPDGKHVGYTALIRGSYDIWWTATDGSGPPAPLITGDRDETEAQWSPDGRSLVFKAYSEATGPDLMLRSLDAPADERRSLVATPLEESSAMLSHDGKWLAYTSGDALYVSPFPATAARTLIGPGARSPRWSGTTHELFFLQGEQLMAARYAERNGSIDIGPPQRLFEAPQMAAHIASFDVAADGKRFLFLVPLTSGSTGDEIHVRLDGFDALQAEFPEKE